MKKILIRFILPFYKLYCDLKWKTRWLNYLKNHKEINLIIGAASTKYRGWFPTDIQFVTDREIQINVFGFDATNEVHYQKKLKGRKISKILAEHVLEHLTLEQIEKMLKNFYKYSEKDLNIRIAVPDGFHKDKKYIDEVKPGGFGEGAWDHKNLFTYQSLSEIFAQNGFKANPVEYWDEEGEFHQVYQNDEKGYVQRSFINDKRNRDGKPNYTSLIMDFEKN